MHPRKELVKAMADFRRALAGQGLRPCIDVCERQGDSVLWEMWAEGTPVPPMGRRETIRRLRGACKRLREDAARGGAYSIRWRISPFGLMLRSTLGVSVSVSVYALPPLPAPAPAG